MHDELADGDLLRFGEGIPKHGVAFVSFVTIRQKVIGLLEIAAVDLVPVNEPRHVDGVLGLKLQRVKFLRLDEDVVALGVLIALDDLFLGDFLEALLGLNTLQIFDRLTTWLMDHAKGNRAFGRGGWKHPDRNEDEGEAKIARPNGNGSHTGYSGNATDIPESGAASVRRK